jgi:hypothetical protein
LCVLAGSYSCLTDIRVYERDLLFR